MGYYGGGVKEILNVDIKQLKKVTKDFYNTTKMKIVLFDDKRNILYSYPEQMCRFCTEVRKSKVLAKECLLCDEKGFNVCDQTKNINVYHCHMGLMEAISVICENGITIGYIMLGQVLDVENKATLIVNAPKIAQCYRIDAKTLVEELNNMQVTDCETIMSAANMMEMCACYLWHNQIISIRAGSLIQHLNNYIYEHLTENLSIKLLCKHLNISKSTLYKISKEHFQLGISDYIRLKRIQKAKDLLKESSLLISEIAVQVGLPDSNYFTKLFKKQTGFTPNKYRKKFYKE